MRSERVEEYLEAISKRQKTEMPVTTSSLAADLDVSLPAVTDMIRRLESDGLIEYIPNKGVTLTDEGNRVALSTIRRHRLWERFLTDILGLKWDKVHDEACRLEHATSPETENRLASLLGDADTCPHGNPIPDKDGNIKDQDVRPLMEFAVGQRVCIASVIKEENRLLKRLVKWGLKPKSIVQIVGKNDDGSLQIKLDGKTIKLDEGTARYLMATSAAPAEEATVEDVPLSTLKTGEYGILKVYGGGKRMLGRCLSMGFTPGSTVRMIENYNCGPLLTKVHDVEVALSRGLADKIIVTKVDSE